MKTPLIWLLSWLKEPINNMILGLKISLVAQSNQSQTLVIELTDEADPLFLYQMACTEQDFHILKSEQQLLVDFQAFPMSFTELVQYCQHDNGYAAVFNSNECVLCIGISKVWKMLTKKYNRIETNYAVTSRR